MQKTNLIKDMVNRFLDKLNPDFSNIDEVYSELLIEYNPDGIDKTEIIFNESISFEGLTSKDKNIKKLSEYIGLKQSRSNLELIDYFNDYVRERKFGFSFFLAYKSNDFEKAFNQLIEKEKQYKFIYKRLTELERIEFKNDFLDQLKRLREVQNATKFKVIIQNLEYKIIEFAEDEEEESELDVDKIQAENKLRNQQILNEYYKSIRNVRIFESAVLNREKDSYYSKKIKNFIDFRKSELDNNVDLICRIGLLKIFNSQLGLIMNGIVYTYKALIDWRKTNNELHEENFRITFGEKSAFLKNDFITSILYNKDNDLLLAFKINEYCLNGFNLMISMLYNELLIDIKKSPLNNDFQELVSTYKKLIEIEKVKLFVNKSDILVNQTTELLSSNEPQQIEINNTDEVKKELHNDIFKGNAFEIFEIYKYKRLITFSSRTDLRVIFDLLKLDELFVQTVDLKHYIRWINKEYFNNSITELRVQNLKSKPNILRVNDYNEIKNTTLKKP